MYTGNGFLDSGFKVDNRMTKAQLEALYQQLLQMASDYCERIIEAPVVEKNTLVIVDCENLNFHDLFPILNSQPHIQICAVIGAHQDIKKFQHPNIIKLKVPFSEKNALDFALVTQLATMLSEDPSYLQAVILSQDKGFDAAVGVLRGKGFDVSRCPRIDTIHKQLSLKDLDVQDIRQLAAEGRLYTRKVLFPAGSVQIIRSSSDAEAMPAPPEEDNCYIPYKDRDNVRKMMQTAYAFFQEADRNHVLLTEPHLIERLGRARGGKNNYVDMYRTYKSLLIEHDIFKITDKIVTIPRNVIANLNKLLLQKKPIIPDVLVETDTSEDNSTAGPDAL